MGLVLPPAGAALDDLCRALPAVLLWHFMKRALATGARGAYSPAGRALGFRLLILSFPFPAAFSALADNHISHNSSLGYLGGVENKPAYPAPPQVTPSRYSPIPRHMIGEEDFTR